MTDSFGARLRRERERRRISIKSIAESTNIRAALFEQLERGDASKWPSGIFRRSFIRAYASAIGWIRRRPYAISSSRFRIPAQAPIGCGCEGLRPSRLARAPELRLRLATGGVAPGRWLAAFCDIVVLAVIALTSVVVFRQLWMPLAICMCAYYAVGTVLTGATPGVFFLGWYRRLGQTTPKPIAASRSAAPFLIHPDRGHGLSLELSPESGRGEQSVAVLTARLSSPRLIRSAREGLALRCSALASLCASAASQPYGVRPRDPAASARMTPRAPGHA